MARAHNGVPAGGARSGRWIALTAAAVVLVLAAATATLAMTHSLSGNASTPRGAGASGPARASRQSGPAAAPAATPVSVLASGNRVVVAAGAAGAPRSRVVALFLASYFAAINAHDYLAYRRLFSLTTRGGLSGTAFTDGYGTTRDSLATLRRIADTGPSLLRADVTFTSHQQPGHSPSHTSCTLWRISLYLVRDGNGYLPQAPPTQYQAWFRACP